MKIEFRNVETAEKCVLASELDIAICGPNDVVGGGDCYLLAEKSECIEFIREVFPDCEAVHADNSPCHGYYIGDHWVLDLKKEIVDAWKEKHPEAREEKTEISGAQSRYRI